MTGNLSVCPGLTREPILQAEIERIMAPLRMEGLPLMHGERELVALFEGLLVSLVTGRLSMEQRLAEAFRFSTRCHLFGRMVIPRVDVQQFLRGVVPSEKDGCRQTIAYLPYVRPCLTVFFFVCVCVVVVFVNDVLAVN